MPQPAALSMFPRRLRRAALLAVLGGSALLGTACSSVSLNEPFEGTPWRLVQMDGQPLPPVGDIDPRTEPQVQFDDNGSRMTGTGGCNRLSAGYRRSGRSLRIGPIASTRAACADPARTAIETRFVAVLEATSSFDLKGAQLTLIDGRALPIAVLELGLRAPR